MQHGNTSIGLRSRWYDELTSMHWRVLRASFLGWIFDGYETLALVVVLAPMLHSVLTPEGFFEQGTAVKLDPQQIMTTALLRMEWITDEIQEPVAV